MAKIIFYEDMLINILLETEKPSGGAAVQTLAWMRGLIEAGQDVSALTSITGNENIKEENKDLKLIPLFDFEKGIRGLRWIYYRIPYLYQKLRDTKPDYLVQGIPDWTSFILGILCSLLRVKFVIRVSSDHLIDERILRFSTLTHRLLMNLGFLLSDAIICQNEYQYKIIQKKYPLKKIAEFGNPFYNKPVGGILSFKERKYIAWVGLFQYQKNIKLLYEIVNISRNEYFKIAGEVLPVGIDLETQEYLTKIRVLKNVEFVGYLNKDEVIDFLRNAKYLLCTSRYEGFSNTFLESMICGTPILTTENANPNGIISKFNLGMVYKNAQDIYDQFHKVASNNYQVMSTNSYKYVRNNHDYRILGNRFLTFLENQQSI